jgi:ABC-type glycerol-3-phosphate transport system substrate-binding protein
LADGGGYDGSGRRRLTRRGLGTAAAGALAAAGVLSLARCGAAGAPAAQTGSLNGTFELLGHDSAVLVAVMEKSIKAFAEKSPEAKITYTAIKQAEVPTKIRSVIAAGSGPDGFYHTSSWWQGIDAGTITQPLTPRIFKRSELEQMSFANLFNALWAKTGEVHYIPYAVGLNAAVLLYNTAHLANANVDPKSLTSLDAMAAAAAKLTQKEGGAISRAGMLVAYHTNLIQNWILDQGGTFYDEKTSKWTWQTAEAERAFQWLMDVFDKRDVSWKANPPGVANPMGEGRASTTLGQGSFAISSYVKSHPDTKLADMPLPGFVPGKAPKYYLPSIAGFSISKLVAPDAPAAKIGAAFYRHLYTLDSAIDFANDYSGAILIKGMYADPRFRSTTFGAVRASLPDQIINKTLTLNNAADPGFMPQVNKVINGELSIKAALADVQQVYAAAEEEAQRSRR